ncbi:MAG: hypothetical protein WC976_07170 [Caldisericia bacterium]
MFNKIIFLVLLVLVSGCATITVESPSHMKVIMATANSRPEKIYRHRVWFAFWGLLPLNNNSSANKIEEQSLRNVKTKVYYRWDDILISFLLSPFTVTRECVEINGDR